MHYSFFNSRILFLKFIYLFIFEGTGALLLQTSFL